MNPEEIRELTSKNFENIAKEIDNDNNDCEGNERYGKLAYLGAEVAKTRIRC